MNGITADQAVLIKNAIKNRRKEKGLAQEELSEAAGIPLSTLKKYEQGTRIPKLGPLVKIGDSLGINLISLISADPVDETAKNERKYKATYLKSDGVSKYTRTLVYDFSELSASEKDKFMLMVSKAYDGCKSGESLIGFMVMAQ